MRLSAAAFYVSGENIDLRNGRTVAGGRRNGTSIGLPNVDFIARVY